MDGGRCGIQHVKATHVTPTWLATQAGNSTPEEKFWVRWPGSGEFGKKSLRFSSALFPFALHDHIAMAEVLRVRIPDKEKAWHPNRPHVLAGTTLALRRSQLKERVAVGLTADWVIGALTPKVSQVRIHPSVRQSARAEPLVRAKWATCGVEWEEKKSYKKATTYALRIQLDGYGANHPATHLVHPRPRRSCRSRQHSSPR